MESTLSSVARRNAVPNSLRYLRWKWKWTLPTMGMLDWAVVAVERETGWDHFGELRVEQAWPRSEPPRGRIPAKLIPRKHSRHLDRGRPLREGEASPAGGREADPWIWESLQPLEGARRGSTAVEIAAGEVARRPRGHSCFDQEVARTDFVDSAIRRPEILCCTWRIGVAGAGLASACSTRTAS